MGLRAQWPLCLENRHADADQNERHVDTVWPLWNAFDMTPGGRGEGFPDGTYKKSLKAIGKK